MNAYNQNPSPFPAYMPPAPQRHKKKGIGWVAWLAIGASSVAVLALVIGGASEDTTDAPAKESAQKVVEAPAPIEKEKKAKKPKPEYTVAQENAIRSAESYLEFAGFSKAGLVNQLTSEYGEGFSRADAEFAVNHVKVNWKAEAVESAESYLEMSGYSRQGLIDQLTSEYGEQFTLKQATYAADKVGL
jgi:hypothetical protein